MKKTILGILLALSLKVEASLNCFDIDQALATLATDDGQILPPIEYFSTVEEKIDENFEEQLIRKSLAAFYYDVKNPSPKKYGEDPWAEVVKSLSGKFYMAVHVGFGGGNSMVYFYEYNTLDFAGVSIIDGVECVDQGDDARLPFERWIPVAKQNIVTCEFGDDSPFKKISLRVSLGPNGTLFWPEGVLSISEPSEMAATYMLENIWPKLVAIDPENERVRTNIKIPAQFGKDVGEMSLTTIVNTDNSARVKGRVYPLSEGYSSQQAVQFKADGICSGSLGIEQVSYHRIIKWGQEETKTRRRSARIAALKSSSNSVKRSRHRIF